MKKLILSATLLVASVGALADDFIVATGGEGGGYERLGYQIVQSVEKQAAKKNVRMDFEVLNTTGSVENLVFL